MPIRVGILGCGRISRKHALALVDHPEAEVTALCDVSQPILDAFITENLAQAPRPTAYTDLDSCFSQAKLDAVIIATPHTMHYQHALTALSADCHIYMEKPMVTSSQQAKELVAKVEKTKRILVVGYNTPCTASFRFLKRVIAAGAQGTPAGKLDFGKLELVSGYLSQNWMKKTTGSWRQDPALSGGGQAYDSGAHLLNSVVWSVQSPPQEVFSYVDNHGAPVDVNSVMNVRFANGVLASLTVSGNCLASGSFLTFIFERGRIDINGWTGEWIRAYGEDGEIADPGVTGSAASPVINFVDSILGKDQPVTDARDGLNHSLLMDAFYASAEQHGPVATAG